MAKITSQKGDESEAKSLHESQDEGCATRGPYMYSKASRSPGARPMPNSMTRVPRTTGHTGRREPSPVRSRELQWGPLRSERAEGRGLRSRGQRGDDGMEFFGAKNPSKGACDGAGSLRWSCVLGLATRSHWPRGGATRRSEDQQAVQPAARGCEDGARHPRKGDTSPPLCLESLNLMNEERSMGTTDTMDGG